MILIFLESREWLKVFESTSVRMLHNLNILFLNYPLKSGGYKNKLSIAFTKLLHPFDLCCEKFDVHSTSRMKRGGEKKKKGKRSASFTRNRPLNFAHWVIVFSRARLRNSKERKRDVGINISLIFPREKIPGKTRLVRAEASMFSTSKMNEDGGRGGKKRRRKRRRRREKKRRKTG